MSKRDEEEEEEAEEEDENEEEEPTPIEYMRRRARRVTIGMVILPIVIASVTRGSDVEFFYLLFGAGWGIAAIAAIVWIVCSIIIAAKKS